MDEYIEREASCKDCIHYCVCKDTVADENWGENASKEIKEMFSPKGCENYTPAADVVEVRHGEWSEVKCGDGIFDYCFFCSECHAHTPQSAFPISPNYCPYCGAKMDGGKNVE